MTSMICHGERKLGCNFCFFVQWDLPVHVYTQNIRDWPSLHRETQQLGGLKMLE